MSPTHRTVLFVDLAGFTAATATHGDVAAADLASRLVALSVEALGPEDRFVKGLGDAVMLVSNDPAGGLALAGRLCHLADSEPAFPLLRIGLHHGPVVERDEDWFGMTVNVTARLAALAGPEQVVATHEVANAAETAGMAVESLGPTLLRGTDTPVELYLVTPCTTITDRSVDPVCRMAVSSTNAAASREVGGAVYVFCSVECATIFAGTIDGG